MLKSSKIKTLVHTKCMPLLWHFPKNNITWLLVPTSMVMGKHWWGLMPARAVYNESLPTGIPIPHAPKSPNPKILSPSVTTIARTSGSGLTYTSPLTTTTTTVKQIKPRAESSFPKDQLFKNLYIKFRSKNTLIDKNYRVIWNKIVVGKYKFRNTMQLTKEQKKYKFHLISITMNRKITIEIQRNISQCQLYCFYRKRVAQRGNKNTSHYEVQVNLYEQNLNFWITVPLNKSIKTRK